MAQASFIFGVEQEKAAAACSDYFSAQRAIRDRIPDIIDVVEEEAMVFCCNSVVLGRDIVMPAGAPRLVRQLEERGYKCHTLEMSEFLKAGGACKCLTMFMPQRESCVA